MSASRHGFCKRAAIRIIGAYKRFLSPVLPYSCRYYPSCSQYCIDAIEKYGLIKGIIMGFLRVSRCNQLFRGGFDPVK